MSGQQEKFRALTGLRGLAACGVMVMHFLAFGSGGIHPVPVLDRLYLAVDLFMILSGFVLAHVYALNAAGQPVREWFPGYVRHRIARIVPLVWAVTLGAILFGVMRQMTPRPSIVATNLLMIQNWWPGIPSVAFPTWSISVEWLANLLLPVYFLLLCVKSGRIRIASATALFVLVLVAASQGSEINQITPLDLTGYPLALLRCLPEFGLGILCWTTRSDGWALTLSRSGILASIALAAFVALMLPRADCAFVALSCFLVIGLSADKSSIARFLGSRPLHWLGEISFSIYMIHALVLGLPAKVVVEALDHAGVPSPGLVHFTFRVIVTLIISALSYYWFERPLQVFLRGPRRVARPILDSPTLAAQPPTTHR